MDDLKNSLAQYHEQVKKNSTLIMAVSSTWFCMVNFNVSQLCMVSEALKTAKDEERDSLLALQSELKELIQLTEESLETVSTTEAADASRKDEGLKEEQNELDDEYALFMVS